MDTRLSPYQDTETHFQPGRKSVSFACVVDLFGFGFLKALKHIYLSPASPGVFCVGSIDKAYFLLCLRCMS